MSEEAKVEERDEEETHEGGDDDEGGEEETYALTDEIERIEDDASNQQRRIKKVALRVKDEHAQLVLRELVGSYEMMRELAAATREALDELEDQIGEAPPPIESFLLEEDAKSIYAVTVANLKLAKEARDACSTTEQREALEKLIAMNEQMLRRIGEMADMSESELGEALES